METLVDLRLQSVRIAASLRDVSSECVIDVAEKIYKYIKRDAQLPESVSMEELVKSIVDASFVNKEKDLKTPPSFLDKDLVVCYD
jgi:hypothetical protein